MLLFTGSVQDVRAALDRGVEVAGAELVDRLLIPQVHGQVEGALRRQGGQINGHLDAVGVVETRTVAAAVLGADQALKTASVDLLDLRIANGLGGKSFFTVHGEVSDVRSSVAAGARTADETSSASRPCSGARAPASSTSHDSPSSPPRAPPSRDRAGRRRSRTLAQRLNTMR